MKTLYVTDLDGTLLNTKDRVSDYSQKIINHLVAEGMLFTYATARSLVSASVVTKGLTTDMPVIAYNGAFIFEAKTGKILASASFSKEEREKVVRFFKEQAVNPLVYSFIDGIEKVSWVKSRENEGIRRYLSLRQGDKRLRPLEEEAGLYDGEIFYFTCIGKKSELESIYTYFSADEHYRCTLQEELYRPNEYWCEIMPKKATKAEGIKTLKQLLGCERIVSFGDAINDLPMFEISDECYAVENAVEALKDRATGIIKNCDQDGVAKWLEKNVRI